MRYSEAYGLMDEWLDYVEHRGRKVKTVKSYRTAIRNIIAFLDAEGMECDPHSIGEDEIHYFINNYNTASENTIRYYIRALGEWMQFYNNNSLKRMGLLWNQNGYPNAKWIYRYELNRMLSYCKDPTERMILLLGAYCGLRRGEMSNLNLDDYDGKQLRVNGKGHNRGQVRMIPLSDPMIKELDDYIRRRENIIDGMKMENNGSLLIYIGWRTHALRVHPDRIGNIVKRIADESGVSCSTHSLRRLFATMMFDNKVEAPVVQNLMGHERIDTTLRYVRYDTAKMKAAMDVLTF